MGNKQKLINSLHTAIKALEEDTVYYVWTNPDCCNAGVVAQAALCKSRDEIKKLRTPLFNKLNSLYREGEDKDMTWRSAIQRCCPITGASGFEIVENLKEAGFDKGDLVHLEYLNNPAILAASGISRKKVWGKKEKSRRTEDSPVIKKFEKKSTSTNLFKRILGIMDVSFEERTVMEKKTVIEYEDYVVREEYDRDYYRKKENLILYLKGWVKILDGKASDIDLTQKQKLQADMMVAAANEDYIEAARLRDELIRIDEGTN
jgi:hypothetical protein